MQINTLKRRLTRIEGAHKPYGDIDSLISRCAYYDEITEAQQSRYLNYIGMTRQDFERTTSAVLGDLHFMLCRFDRPTQNEIELLLQGAN